MNVLLLQALAFVIYHTNEQAGWKQTNSIFQQSDFDLELKGIGSYYKEKGGGFGQNVFSANYCSSKAYGIPLYVLKEHLLTLVTLGEI